MTAILLALAVLGGLNDRLYSKQIRIDFVVYKGDPLGSKAEGTVQLLAEPSIIAMNGQSAFLMAGGNEVVKGPDGKDKQRPFGFKLEFTPTVQPDGTIRLGVTTTFSEPLELQWIPAGGEKPAAFTEHTVRHTRVVKAGEKFRVRIAADSPAAQMWAEVTVREEQR